MRCPRCQALDTKVIDSRETEEGASIRRRRSCLSCARRFTTDERHFFQALVAARLGEKGTGSAVMAAQSGHPGNYALALMDTTMWWSYLKWHGRLPAVVAELRRRFGDDRLAAAVNDFLARSGTPGTARELFDILESETGVPA